MENQNTQQEPVMNSEVTPMPAQVSNTAPAQPAPSSTTVSANQPITPAETSQNATQVTQTNIPKVSMEEKLFGLLSYVILFSFFTLLFKPKSDFVRLHGRQGLVLTAFFFLSLFLLIIPFIGEMLSPFIAFCIIVMGIFSGYKALMGNWWKIPAVGDIAEQIPMTLFEKAGKEAVGAITGTTPSSTPEEQPTQNQSEVQPPSTNPPVQPN